MGGQQLEELFAVSTLGSLLVHVKAEKQNKQATYFSERTCATPQGQMPPRSGARSISPAERPKTATGSRCYPPRSERDKLLKLQGMEIADYYRLRKQPTITAYSWREKKNEFNPPYPPRARYTPGGVRIQWVDEKIPDFQGISVAAQTSNIAVTRDDTNKTMEATGTATKQSEAVAISTASEEPAALPNDIDLQSSLCKNAQLVIMYKTNGGDDLATSICIKRMGGFKDINRLKSSQPFREIIDQITAAVANLFLSAHFADREQQQECDTTVSDSLDITDQDPRQDGGLDTAGVCILDLSNKVTLQDEETLSMCILEISEQETQQEIGAVCIMDSVDLSEEYISVLDSQTVNVSDHGSQGDTEIMSLRRLSAGTSDQLQDSVLTDFNDHENESREGTVSACSLGESDQVQDAVPTLTTQYTSDQEGEGREEIMSLRSVRTSNVTHDSEMAELSGHDPVSVYSVAISDLPQTSAGILKTVAGSDKETSRDNETLSSLKMSYMPQDSRSTMKTLDIRDQIRPEDEILSSLGTSDLPQDSAGTLKTIDISDQSHRGDETLNSLRTSYLLQDSAGTFKTFGDENLGSLRTSGLPNESAATLKSVDGSDRTYHHDGILNSLGTSDLPHDSVGDFQTIFRSDQIKDETLSLSSVKISELPHDSVGNLQTIDDQTRDETLSLWSGKTNELLHDSLNALKASDISGPKFCKQGQQDRIPEIEDISKEEQKLSNMKRKSTVDLAARIIESIEDASEIMTDVNENAALTDDDTANVVWADTSQNPSKKLPDTEDTGEIYSTTETIVRVDISSKSPTVAREVETLATVPDTQYDAAATNISGTQARSNKPRISSKGDKGVKSLPDTQKLVNTSIVTEIVLKNASKSALEEGNDEISKTPHTETEGNVTTSAADLADVSRKSPNIAQSRNDTAVTLPETQSITTVPTVTESVVYRDLSKDSHETIEIFQQSNPLAADVTRSDTDVPELSESGRETPLSLRDTQYTPTTRVNLDFLKKVTSKY